MLLKSHLALIELLDRQSTEPEDRHAQVLQQLLPGLSLDLAELDLLGIAVGFSLSFEQILVDFDLDWGGERERRHRESSAARDPDNAVRGDQYR